MRPFFWLRLLNRIGLRHDRIICIRQANTYVWGDNLGPITPDWCSVCGEPIYYERQNRFFTKVCHVCMEQGR